MTGQCPHTESIGALLVGALAAEERRELVRHLRECVTCRAEAVSLAPLPGLLHRLRTPKADR